MAELRCCFYALFLAALGLVIDSHAAPAQRLVADAQPMELGMNVPMLMKKVHRFHVRGQDQFRFRIDFG